MPSTAPRCRRRHRRGTSVGLALFALVAALVLVPGPGAGAPPGVAPAPAAGAPGVGDPYWPLDGNGGIDVEHYDIHVTYDLAAAHLSGVTTLSVRATQDLSTFQLDLLLPVSSVTVDGRPATFDRPDVHELRVRPDATLAEGQRFVVEVAYAGRPGSARYAGERSWAASAEEVVTMNQPHMAPWWFPADDHPSDKARFDITVTAPASHQVVANGLPLTRSVEGDLATTHWRARDPMATYLAFFAIGRFDVTESARGGLPSYLAVSRALPNDLREMSAHTLRSTPMITAWLERRLGPYPFEATGGLATSLDVGFALENQTRPTYASGVATDRSTVVHELAHQWFGDAVSLRRWRDIWLNEGFATFMEVAYDEMHGGPSAQAWLGAAYRRNPAGSALWTLDLTDPGPRRLFDRAVYERGAMALQALRHRIGERDFWTTLRTWLRQRRGAHGTVDAFTRLASRVADEPLGRFFTAWLRAERRPAPTRALGLR